MNYLHPDILISREPFGTAFDITKNVFDKEMLLSAHKLLKLFMIRRLKNEVEKLMPPKIETKVCINSAHLNINSFLSTFPHLCLYLIHSPNYFVIHRSYVLYQKLKYFGTEIFY